ncbi:MAG: 1-acyl-sn-glycerol-3-phosphate acyltransferase [Acidimicrobiales bacterium]|jgi:1-acyl-sn-glycerol-3-phosphate acyltransferase|nr:1-acyl-sn-glycerol-3-phosphate acyltransferase [Acidimicrobiales bacterium]
MDAQGLAVRRAFTAAGELVARYTRLDYEPPAEMPPPPAVLVVNHGFGGVVDLNVLAFAGLTARMGVAPDQPATILTHQLVWTVGVGRWLEPAGCRPAGPTVAREALARGEYVLVSPGGDLDAGKPWRARNEIRFAGRTGYARLAVEAGVPILPTVIVGAGESLLVLSDGQRLARALGVDRRLRNRTLPVTVSIPWGLSIGLVGLLPYVPLPTKLRAETGPAFVPGPDESAEELADRVHTWMQDTADRLTAGRVPVLGWQMPRR